jgi:hypothetical protein
MSNEPQERLILLRLALEGGEIKNTEFKPELKKQDRDRLMKARLIEAERLRPPERGRAALHLALTDCGWGWLAEHLDGELPAQAKPVKSLQKILVCLKAHLNAHGYSLADFITGPPPKRLEVPADVDKLIESAYFDLSGGRANVRVRLADLRAALPDIPRDRLDATLLAMATRGGVALYPLENPVEIQPRDREAVLRTPTGHERHLVYLGGKPS